MIEVEEMPLKSEIQNNIPLDEGKAVKSKTQKRGQTWLYVISIALGLLIVGAIIAGIVNAGEISLSEGVDKLLTIDFALFVLAGFVAQMIDGALGMAYGASCSSILMSFGVAPAVASASVQTRKRGQSGMMSQDRSMKNRSEFNLLYSRVNLM